MKTYSKTTPTQNNIKHIATLFSKSPEIRDAEHLPSMQSLAVCQSVSHFETRQTINGTLLPLLTVRVNEVKDVNVQNTTTATETSKDDFCCRQTIIEQSSVYSASHLQL